MTMREDLIAAKMAGKLHPALSLLVESQAFIDDEAAREDYVAATIGGAFLEAETPAAMREDALAEALNTVRGVPMEPAPRQRAAKAAGQALADLRSVPDPILDLAIEAASTRGWRKPMKGVERLELMRDGDLSAELIRVKGGVGVPAHGHSGREYTLCLQGAFRQDGATYGRGDLVIADTDHVHTPHAEEGEDVLAFVVTEAPLKYRGAFGLLQRIFKFR